MDDPNDHTESFQPTPPSFLVNLLDQVVEFLAAYGWYFLAISLVILIYWERIRNYLDQRYRDQSEKEYEAKCKKDPDWLQQRQREMETARKRMQEELDRKAAEHAAKMKEREEQRRAAVLASNTEGGQRLGYGGEATTTANTSETSSTKKPYRPEGRAEESRSACVQHGMCSEGNILTRNNYSAKYHPLMGGGSSGGYRPSRRGCPGGGCG